MLRPMSFLAALLWLIIPSTPCRAQDQTQDQAQPQPSLADVARQARKDKEKNAANSKTVITDDTLPSSKGLGGWPVTLVVRKTGWTAAPWPRRSPKSRKRKQA